METLDSIKRQHEANPTHRTCSNAEPAVGHGFGRMRCTRHGALLGNLDERCLDLEPSPAASASVEPSVPAGDVPESDCPVCERNKQTPKRLSRGRGLE